MVGVDSQVHHTSKSFCVCLPKDQMLVAFLGGSSEPKLMLCSVDEMLFNFASAPSEFASNVFVLGEFVKSIAKQTVTHNALLNPCV